MLHPRFHGLFTYLLNQAYQRDKVHRNEFAVCSSKLLKFNIALRNRLLKLYFLNTLKSKKKIWILDGFRAQGGLVNRQLS